jgi:hypothetical protein
MSDVPELEPRGSFAQGIALGFGLAALAIHLALVSMGGDWAAAYKDLGRTLPLLTRVALSPIWRAGVPLVGGALMAALIVRRPQATAFYVALAVALGIAAAMTWWFPTLPIYELAGNIK